MMSENRKEIANRERDRIAAVLRRDGTEEALKWAERVRETYSSLIGVIEWHWNQTEFKVSIEELTKFISTEGILDKRRFELPVN